MQTDFQPAEFAAELRDWFRRSVRDGGQPPLPFESLALRLFGLQFTRNAAYRRLCEARHATPDRIRLWQDIPAAPTVAFKELEITSLTPGERAAVFHSSGTATQKPSRHFHSHESLALYEVSLAAWFQPHVLPGWFERQSFVDFLALTPPPAEAPNSSLVHMFATVQREFGHGEPVFTGRRGGDGSWVLDFERTLDRLHQSEISGQPLVILGTAFSFVHLTDELVRRGLRARLPAGSRAMETGGYKGRSRELPRAELHEAITRNLGIPASHLVCEYGMSELSSQAYTSSLTPIGNSQSAISNSRSLVLRFPPWCRAVVVSPETGREVSEGETGLLRVFDLANVWSVMAIQAEDLAVRGGGGFELIGRATAAEPRGCSLMAAAAVPVPCSLPQ